MKNSSHSEPNGSRLRTTGLVFSKLIFSRISIFRCQTTSVPKLEKNTAVVLEPAQGTCGIKQVVIGSDAIRAAL